jgi:hypothetical protein
MKRLLFILAILMIALVLSGYAYTTRPTSAGGVGKDAIPQGHDQLAPDGVLINGFQLRNYGPEANFLDAYTRDKAFLGHPITSFDGATQTFAFGRLSYNATNPQTWKGERDEEGATRWVYTGKVVLDDLGLQHLERQGLTPAFGAVPNPIVEAWVRTHAPEPDRTIGPFLSEPRCDKRTGQCQQYSTKSLFVWPEGSEEVATVQRAPLGLWLTPQPAAATSSPLSWLVPVLVVGFLAVVAVAFILRPAKKQRTRSLSV